MKIIMNLVQNIYLNYQVVKKSTTLYIQSTKGAFVCTEPH